VLDVLIVLLETLVVAVGSVVMDFCLVGVVWQGLECLVLLDIVFVSIVEWMQFNLISYYDLNPLQARSQSTQ
jgi:hypothetical protein